jgi:hypothetical protein
VKSFEIPVPADWAQERVEAWRMFSALQADGLTQRSLLGRRIAHACWPEIFDHVAFEADAPFCEPFLFSVALNREFSENIPAIFKYYAENRHFNCINNYKYNFKNIFFLYYLLITRIYSWFCRMQTVQPINYSKF